MVELQGVMRRAAHEEETAQGQDHRVLPVAPETRKQHVQRERKKDKVNTWREQCNTYQSAKRPARQWIIMDAPHKVASQAKPRIAAMSTNSAMSGGRCEEQAGLSLERRTEGPAPALRVLYDCI